MTISWVVLFNSLFFRCLYFYSSSSFVLRFVHEKLLFCVNHHFVPNLTLLLKIFLIELQYHAHSSFEGFSWLNMWSLELFPQSVWCILKLCHSIIYHLIKAKVWSLLLMWIWVTPSAMAELTIGWCTHAHAVEVTRARRDVV